MVYSYQQYDEKRVSIAACENYEMSRQLNRVVLGLTFILAGLNHFRRPQLYLSIMPDYLPWHRALVAISGYAEVVLGALALIPRLRFLARWGLSALLIAVFPANLHMAVQAQRYPAIPRWLLWLRLPFQGLLIAWVWRSTMLQRSGENLQDQYFVA
jgi:uncharacterized membrane protein